MTNPRPKSPELKFHGRIVKDKEGNKHWKPSKPHWLQEYMNKHFKEAQEANIRITRHFKGRTTGKEDEEGNQNGYLYAVVLPLIAEYTGDTIGDTLQRLEAKFSITGYDASGLPIIKRFKDMTTVEFNWAIIDAENPNSVRSWALQFLEIDIPEPDKEYKNRGYSPAIGTIGEPGDNEDGSK